MVVDGEKVSRKRKFIQEKFKIGEEVEVLFMDEGLAGSWHAGVVIGSGVNCRHIRYIHLVDDDQQSQYEQWITVSSAIIAANSISTPEDYRGNIRPPAPRHDIQVSDIKYGVCVDVLVNDAWWEGVIFDNEDDSSERLFFFPDEGDMQKVAIDQLRLTQEWDEVYGCWKPRGKWMLLQVLDTIKKKEDFFPVSVRQIWYDLRCTDAFLDEIGFWPRGSQHIWHKLVSNLIQELLSVVNAPLLPRTSVSNFTNAPLTHLDNNCSGALSEFVLEFHNRDGPLSPCRRRFIDKLGCTESHLLAKGWKIEDNFYVSPEGEKYNSFIEACEACTAIGRCRGVQDIIMDDRRENMIEDEDNKAEGYSASTVTKSWKAAEIQPEYCDDFATMCASYIKYGARNIGYQNLQILKKHLLHLGWRIEFKRDITRRYRYISPNRKTCYHSLNKLICDLMDQEHRDLNILGQPQVAMRNSSHTKLSSGDVKQFALKEDTSLKNDYAKDSSDVSEMADFEGLLNSENNCCTSIKQSTALNVICMKEVSDEVYLPESIIKYKEFIENGQQKKVLLANAKKHLELTGWSLQMKDKTTKRKLCCISSMGKNYSSLYRACKGFLEEHQKNSIKKSTICMETVGQNNVQSNITAEKSDDFQVDAHIFHEGVKEEQRICPANLCSGLVQQSSGKISINKKKRKAKTTPHINQCRVSISKFSTRLLRSRKRSKLGEALSSTSQYLSKTVLSWLIDKDMILPRQKVAYIRETDGCAMKHGRVTREGIKCNCCDKVFSLANYEAHAGCSTSRPAAFIFLQDGKSLLQYQIRAVLATKPKYVPYVRLKRDNSEYEGDIACSICCDGGNLLLCDHCPSAFHSVCVGLEANITPNTRTCVISRRDMASLLQKRHGKLGKDVPEGSWWCSSCQCRICGLSEFNCNANQFTEESVLYCDQCEQGYHVGCLRERGSCVLSSCPTGNWVCGKNCSKIFNHLQKSLGKSNPTTVEGLSWTILRSSGGNIMDKFDDETLAEYHSKLYIALDVLHECFEPLVESRTQSDIVADLLFNRLSELRRLNFRGIYTIILERGDEIASVATFRVYGEKVAEMPFIGTRIKFRHQGMCRLLVSELEKLLSELGVERLVLPAVPQLVQTWTGSFGFTRMTNSDRMELLAYNLLNFQDAFMCQKFLKTPATAPEAPRRGD